LSPQFKVGSDCSVLCDAESAKLLKADDGQKLSPPDLRRSELLAQIPINLRSFPANREKYREFSRTRLSQLI
jgi:hypothetical protein